eukprot:6775742-Prymnesium_polylepis.1
MSDALVDRSVVSHAKENESLLSRGTGPSDAAVFLSPPSRPAAGKESCPDGPRTEAAFSSWERCSKSRMDLALPPKTLRSTAMTGHAAERDAYACGTGGIHLFFSMQSSNTTRFSYGALSPSPPPT